MTRAKEKLYLISAAYRLLYGTPSSNLMSRFVNEVPKDVLECLNPGGAPMWRTPGRDYASGRWSRPENAGQGARQGGEGGYSEPRRQGYPKGAGNSQGFAGSNGGREGFRAGDKVSHPVFGTGTVVNVAKTAGDTVVTVAFEGQGVKRLALSFAPLSRK